MNDFDGDLTPVPRIHRAAAELLARISAQVLCEHGVLCIVECWPDEARPGASAYRGVTSRQPTVPSGSFALAAGARKGETVVLSWVEWLCECSRDEGMALVEADLRKQLDDRAPVFDGSCLIATGFVPMPDSDPGPMTTELL